MADNLTPAQRSYCMSRVRGRDTLLEQRLRSALHRRGLRFRKHVSGLPGKPDLVIKSAGVIVFIDGDFWHGYRFPAWRGSLSPWWRAKIERTRARDLSNFRKLRTRGWVVIRLWQHSIEADLEGCIRKVFAACQSNRGPHQHRRVLMAG